MPWSAMRRYSFAISNDLKGEFHRRSPRLGSCSMQAHLPQASRTYCVWFPRHSRGFGSGVAPLSSA